MPNTKTIKYNVSCQFHQLKINKNIDFQTKIIWKRHQNKAETKSVNHAHGFSIFNETLTLEFNMLYNYDTHQFQPKNTQIVAIIVYQGKVKSGGYIKYNIAQNLNLHPHQISKVMIPLTQCPDPTAFIEASFSYQKVSGQLQIEQQSILNVSSRDLNMSRVDFHDDKLSFEMDKIVDVIRKFQNLGEEVKKRGKEQNKKMPELITKLETSEGEVKTLKGRINKLQKKIEEKEEEFQSEKKKFKKQVEDLEKRIQVKNKEIKEIKTSEAMNSENSQYKNLYENALRELDQLRQNNPENGTLKKSLDLKFSSQMQDVAEIAKFDSKQENESEKIEDLSRQNVELQSQVASMSHKIAQLFNASYEFGGAKLLDYLQTSIGLTEFIQ